MFTARKHYRTEVDSVILLQSLARKRTSYLSYQALRSSIIVLQSRQRYFKTISSIIQIQSLYRMFTARKHYRTEVDSVIMLQSLARKRIFNLSYQALRSSIIVLQSRQRYFKTISSVIRIQRAYRRYSESKKYCHIRLCAIVIQTHFRLWHAMQVYRAKQQAAIKLQAQWRRFAAEETFWFFYNSAVIVQTFTRQFLAQKKYYSTRSIVIASQANVRRALEVKGYSKKKKAVVVLQKYSRSYNSRRSFVAFVSAVVKLQALFRSKQTQARYLIKVDAIVAIQSRIRSSLAHRRYLMAVNGFTQLQSAARSATAKEQYLATQRFASHSQRCVRGYIVRQRFARVLSSATQIQSLYRMFSAEKAYHTERRAATCIQKRWRGYRAEGQYLDMILSATTIQATFRRHRHEKNFHSTVRALVLLQTFMRMCNARRQLKAAVAGSTSIQAMARRHRVNKNYKAMRAAAVVIQKIYRGFLVEMAYLDMVTAVIIQQTWWRRFSAEKEYRKRLAEYNATASWAATLIQSQFRKYFARKQYKKMRELVPAFSIKARVRHINKMGLEDALSPDKTSYKYRRYSSALLGDSLSKETVPIGPSCHDTDAAKPRYQKHPPSLSSVSSGGISLASRLGTKSVGALPLNDNVRTSSLSTTPCNTVLHPTQDDFKLRQAEPVIPPNSTDSTLSPGSTVARESAAGISRTSRRASEELLQDQERKLSPAKSTPAPPISHMSDISSQISFGMYTESNTPQDETEPLPEKIASSITLTSSEETTDSAIIEENVVKPSRFKGLRSIQASAETRMRRSSGATRPKPTEQQAPSPVSSNILRISSSFESRISRLNATPPPKLSTIGNHAVPKSPSMQRYSHLTNNDLATSATSQRTDEQPGSLHQRTGRHIDRQASRPTLQGSARDVPVRPSLRNGRPVEHERAATLERGRTAESSQEYRLPSQTNMPTYQQRSKAGASSTTVQSAPLSLFQATAGKGGLHSHRRKREERAGMNSRR